MDNLSLCLSLKIYRLTIIVISSHLFHVYAYGQPMSIITVIICADDGTYVFYSFNEL